MAAGSQGSPRLRSSYRYDDLDVLTVLLSGELDEGTALVVVRAVTFALDKRPHALVLDLADLSALTRAGLHVLRAAQDRAATEGVALRLVVPAAGVAGRTLAEAGMAAVFDVYPDLAAARVENDRTRFLRRMRRRLGGR
ncbi:STAS domain-containing protein [Amycolatopsis jiangsuensis]|uniref:Anti-anti-sigma factor n=1 Tax=Amycolatopsis jiangsuensis TaxID=1181879 RepID=A0A840ISJ4_9PSEU|nr:STAS domain-containing protein [Amycolatopsis jiangsuensis]MBB4684172.1 anti-anti-sigma factor [Amycolatopsis jiangsuensis]